MIVSFSSRAARFSALAAVFGGASVASAQLTPTPPIPPGNVFFDYFLFDNLGRPANNFGSSPLPVEQFAQWTVSEGTVDLLGGSVLGADDLPDGRYVDLDGSTNDAGRFQTRVAFPFAPLLTYELFFEYWSTDGAANAADVTVAGQTFSVATSSQAVQTFSRTFTVNAAGLSPISFLDRGNDSAGIGIDAVLLNIVPEPTTGLAAAALVSAFGVRRRRA